MDERVREAEMAYAVGSSSGGITSSGIVGKALSSFSPFFGKSTASTAPASVPPVSLMGPEWRPLTPLLINTAEAIKELRREIRERDRKREAATGESW